MQCFVLPLRYTAGRIITVSVFSCHVEENTICLIVEFCRFCQA